MEKKLFQFNDLSIFKKFTIKIGKYFFPVKIHIKNIYYNKDEELEVGLLGEYDDPFYFEYKKLKEIEYYNKYLKHINVEDKLFKNFTQSFLEYHELDSVYDILYIIDKFDISKLVKEISEIEAVVISEYRRRLYNMLKIDQKKPHIPYENENPKSPEISNYLSYSQGYIFIQTLKEFNPTPFFKENYNKAIDEWSLREIELHMSYITQKFRTDEVSNLWEASVMKKNSKQNNKR